MRSLYLSKVHLSSTLNLSLPLIRTTYSNVRLLKHSYIYENDRKTAKLKKYRHWKHPRVNIFGNGQINNFQCYYTDFICNEAICRKIFTFFLLWNVYRVRWSSTNGMDNDEVDTEITASFYFTQMRYEVIIFSRCSRIGRKVIVLQQQLMSGSAVALGLCVARNLSSKRC